MTTGDEWTGRGKTAIARLQTRLEHGPVHLTVRQFLRLWGIRVRDFDTVARIAADLSAARLRTDPPFETASPFDTVHVIPLERPTPQSATTEASPSSEGTTSAPDDPGEESSPHHDALRVSAIPSATEPVRRISPTDSLLAAQTVMSEGNIDHLAVIDGETFRGAITWRSIALMNITGAAPTLANATETCETVYADDPLLDKLPFIRDNGYAYVRDNATHRICGLVTVSDITKQYDDLVGPFLDVSEIERRLRRTFARRFTKEHLRQVKKKATSIDDFMFGEYKLLLNDDARWSLLNWQIDRPYFLERLDGVRRARNKVMHFRPDQLTTDDIARLRNFAAWLRNLDAKP